MDDILVVGILVVFAVGIVLVGTVVFFVWAAQYFGRRAYRRVTRRHLYVPVVARVTHAMSHRRCGTLYVVYEFGGTEIATRLLTTPDVARLAEHSKQVPLQIDPDYPKDVVVAPAFEEQALVAAPPVNWRSPLGAGSFLSYALRLFGCLLLGGGFAVVLVSLRGRLVDGQFFVVGAVVLSLIYVVCLLFAFSRFKSQTQQRQPPAAAEEMSDRANATSADPNATTER